MNQPGYTFCLICGQGVHGVDYNGLDARFAPVTPAVIQNRIEKTFRLSRTCAGSDDRGSRFFAGKPLKGSSLVVIGLESQGDAGEEVLTYGGCAVGELNGEIGSFEDAAVLPQKPVHDTMKERCRYGERGLKKILNTLLDLTGQDGWDHLLPPEFMSSLSEVDKGILQAYIRGYRQKRPAGFLSSN